MISRDLVKMFHLYIIMNIIGLIIYYEIETVFTVESWGTDGMSYILVSVPWRFDCYKMSRHWLF